MIQLNLHPSIILAVCKRSWIKTLRRPVLLSFSLLQPMMWMLFFGFLFQSYAVQQLPDDLRYLDFLLPGICSMTLLLGASQSGIELIRDMQNGFLARTLMTPAAPVSVLGGKLLADVLRLLLQASLVLALGVLLGAQIQLNGFALWQMLLAWGLFALAFCCLSCCIALLTRTQEMMAVFVHTVNMPILFTSSALVPTRQMPDWLAAWAHWNPLTEVVNAGRAALLSEPFAHQPVALGPVLILALGLLMWAGWLLKRFQTDD